MRLSSSVLLGAVALLFAPLTWAQLDEGDLIARFVSSKHEVIRKELALASKDQEQADALENMFKGFTFKAGKDQVTGQYFKTPLGTTAVFKSTSGNVYTYKVDNEPSFKLPFAKRRLNWLSSITKAATMGAASIPSGSSTTSGKVVATSSDAGAVTTTAAATPAPSVVTAQATQGPCAWQAYVTGRRFNAAFPDLSAVYQVLVQTGIGPTNVLRIQGKFPKARYFSVQSYNVKAGMPVASLADYQIKADEGSVNPFENEQATEGGTGTYTIHVTLRKDARFANSLPLCTDEMSAKKCNKVTALILVRIYSSDPNAPNHDCFTDPPDNTPIPRLWGYVGPPTVSLTNTKKVNRKTNEWNWRKVANCDPTKPTVVSNVLTNYMGSMVPDFPSPPAYANKNDNFYMYLGKETVDAGTFTNMDATYMAALGHQASLPADVRGQRLVAKITGVLPKHAMDWATDPKINKKDDYDVRYVSYSSVAFTSGGPTIDTVSDVEMGAFYKDNAAFKENRTFSIVMAQDKNSTCDFYDPEQDLFLSTIYNGTAQDYIGVLYRQVVSKHQRDLVPDKSIGYARVACTAGGKKEQCDSPKFLEGVMKEHYPSIEWYTCSQVDGIPVLTPVDMTLQEFLDNRKA